jgi:hypothetical protein
MEAQGDGAIPAHTMEIMVHEVKDHIASHKTLCFSYSCLYILDMYVTVA